MYLVYVPTWYSIMILRVITLYYVTLKFHISYLVTYNQVDRNKKITIIARKRP